MTTFQQELRKKRNYFSWTRSVNSINCFMNEKKKSVRTLLACFGRMMIRRITVVNCTYKQFNRRCSLRGTNWILQRFHMLANHSGFHYQYRSNNAPYSSQSTHWSYTTFVQSTEHYFNQLNCLHMYATCFGMYSDHIQAYQHKNIYGKIQ